MTRVAWAVVAASILLTTAGCGAHRARFSARNVDLSHRIGMDAEVSAALDPSDARTLLAGSIGLNSKGMLVYRSTDGGSHWSRALLTPLTLGACYADPAVAIGPDGREYYAYLRLPCTAQGAELFMRTRMPRARRWGPPHPIPHAQAAAAQDRPALAVDSNPQSVHRGRIWVAWAEYARRKWAGAFLSHSDDGGLRWSAPDRLDEGGFEPSVAIAANGTPIEASVDVPAASIVVSSPGPAGFEHFIDATAATGAWCSTRRFLPAVPQHRICATPSIAIDEKRRIAYVAWSGTTDAGRAGVFVRRFALSQLAGGRPSPALPPPIDRPASGSRDEFLPTAAVDPQTGALWVCFYETAGAARRRARFVCRVSRDEAKTWIPLVAASRTSDESTDVASPFGYGDYESVAAAAGMAHAFWTAQASFYLADEVFTTTLREPH